jgi:hypothetical protein
MSWPSASITRATCSSRSNDAEVRALAASIAEKGDVSAVAVVLLFSYVNPVHERRVKEIFAEVAPELPVSISYDVLPRWKEYERASTTIADAALKPVVSRQMRAVKARLAGGGIPARVSAIRSNGGEMTLDAAAEAPVQLALSGPTGGVVGCTGTTSASGQAEKATTCPVRSIAAREVEGLVLGQVRRLLASPELIARTITAVRRENGAAEDTDLEEGDVIEALGVLEPVWDELYPAEQARIMRLLIERIDVAPDGISVTLRAAGIRSLVAELADQETAGLAASEPVLEAAE